MVKFVFVLFPFGLNFLENDNNECSIQSSSYNIFVFDADMIEVSAVYKKIHFFMRKNKFFIGKLEESRKLFKDKIFN